MLQSLWSWLRRLFTREARQPYDPTAFLEALDRQAAGQTVTIPGDKDENGKLVWDVELPAETVELTPLVDYLAAHGISPEQWQKDMGVYRHAFRGPLVRYPPGVCGGVSLLPASSVCFKQLSSYWQQSSNLTGKERVTTGFVRFHDRETAEAFAGDAEAALCFCLQFARVDECGTMKAKSWVCSRSLDGVTLYFKFVDEPCVPG